jgi:hypothetical protein
MNPWWSRYAEDGLHAEWDVEWKETAAADIQAFSALAHLCLQTPRWFGLWIPFRRAAHLAGVEPIEKTEPKADLNELFGEGLGATPRLHLAIAPPGKHCPGWRTEGGQSRDNLCGLKRWD